MHEPVSTSSTDNNPTSAASGIARLHRAIARGKTTGGIALVSHAVLGYPAPSDNLPTIKALVDAGAEVMELQFPFSDPVADGPILTAANQAAVSRGITVDDCFALTRQACAAHPATAFVVMTYFNMIYRRGIEQFVHDVAEAGAAAIIVPDLPPEESEEFRIACARYGIGTIFLVTPITGKERIAFVARLTTGFVYCVGRAGVTGKQTDFDGDLTTFVQYVASVSPVPIGVGFGVRTREDITALKPLADLAMVCTEVVRRIDANGVVATATYLSSLR